MARTRVVAVNEDDENWLFLNILKAESVGYADGCAGKSKSGVRMM